MKKTLIWLGVLILLFISFVLLALSFFRPKLVSTIATNPQIVINNYKKQMLTLASPVFKNNEMMQSRFTCDGSDVLPPLEISGVSPDTKFLAIIMDDPDAPNGDWVHWVKWNIPPNIKAIEEGKEPEGVSGKGTGGNLTYMGPCPPSGTHHYHFKLYALDAMLDLKAGSSKAELLKVMQRHIVGQTELIGLYSRTQ